jgi:hypothetical protein
MRLIDFQKFKRCIASLEKSRELVVGLNKVKFVIKDIRRRSLRHSRTTLKMMEDTSRSSGMLVGIPGSDCFVYICDDNEEIDLYDDIDIAKHIYSEYALWWTTITNIPIAIVQPIVEKIKILLELKEEKDLSFLNLNSFVKVSFLDKQVISFVNNRPIFAVVSDDDFGKTKVIEDIEIVAKGVSLENDMVIVKTVTNLPLCIPKLYPNNSTFSGIRIKKKDDDATPVTPTPPPVFIKVRLNGVLYNCYCYAVSVRNNVIIDAKGKEIMINDDNVDNVLVCEVLSRSFN